MDKENVVYTGSGILLSLKKEGNPSIYDNIDGPGGHSAKWNNPDTENDPDTDTMWSHLYVESNIVKFLEAENRMMVFRAWQEGTMGRWFRGITYTVHFTYIIITSVPPQIIRGWGPLIYRIKYIFLSILYWALCDLVPTWPHLSQFTSDIFQTYHSFVPLGLPW